MIDKPHNVRILIAFIVGLLFAVGLGISGMTQPQKVIGFLQIGKNWDPSLMFVMIGAIPVHAFAYKMIRNKETPFLDVKFQVPTSREISKPLVIGSALFGFGWALGGYCPGPALTSVGAGAKTAIIFVVFMILGMYLERLFEKFKIGRAHV